LIKAKYHDRLSGWTAARRHRFNAFKQEVQTASPTKRNQMLIDVIREEPGFFFKIHAIATLIDEGANINAPNNPTLSPTKSHYFTPDRRPVAVTQGDPINHMGALEWAAYLEQGDIVDLLCELGANVHAHNSFAAHTVLTRGTKRTTAVKAMMQAGAAYTDPKSILHLSDLAVRHGDYEFMKHVMAYGKISPSNFPVAFDMAARRDDITTLGPYIEKHKPYLNEYHLESIVQKDAVKLLDFLIRYTPDFIESELSYLGPELVENKSTKCLRLLLEHYGPDMDIHRMEFSLRNRIPVHDPQYQPISDELDHWHKKARALNSRDVSVTADGRLTMIEKGVIYTDKTPLTLHKLTQRDAFGNNAIDYLSHRNRLSQILNPRFWQNREAEFTSLIRSYIPYRHQNKAFIQDILQVKAELSIARHMKSRPRKPLLKSGRRP
ncbi:MAG: hypothetical protein ACQEQL_05120, partial [Pseudomonadota bacterium]